LLASLPLEPWQDTYALSMWTQIVGKVRLGLTPLVNHWWNFPSTSAHRADHVANSVWRRAFEVWFDFLQHRLVLQTSDGGVRTMPLARNLSRTSITTS